MRIKELGNSRPAEDRNSSFWKEHRRDEVERMDHLKAVGKAIKNSPRALRKKFVHVDHHERECERRLQP